MGEMFNLLKQGLDEILDHQKGKRQLKSKKMELPKPAKKYSAKEVKRIRESLEYPQLMFAKFLNVSIKTVQSWECGRRIPNHAALRLLEIVDKGYYRPTSIK